MLVYEIVFSGLCLAAQGKTPADFYVVLLDGSGAVLTHNGSTIIPAHAPVIFYQQGSATAVPSTEKPLLSFTYSGDKAISDLFRIEPTPIVNVDTGSGDVVFDKTFADVVNVSALARATGTDPLDPDVLTGAGAAAVFHFHGSGIRVSAIPTKIPYDLRDLGDQLSGSSKPKPIADQIVVRITNPSSDSLQLKKVTIQPKGTAPIQVRNLPLDAVVSPDGSDHKGPEVHFERFYEVLQLSPKHRPIPHNDSMLKTAHRPVCAVAMATLP